MREHKRCRSILSAVCVNEVLWNDMIAGYAQHGLAIEELRLFERLIRAGTKTDEITFVGVLSACSHVGLVQEA
jgi:hypothetical protein